MTLWEMLKATKGLPVSDPFAAMYGASRRETETETEIAGVPPLRFTSRTAGSLTDYRIYGDTVQDGTPSPDMPVDVVGCGVRTENLFDKDEYLVGGSPNPSIATNFRHVISLKPNTTYTMSSNVPYYAGNNHLYIYLESYSVNRYDIIYNNHPLTITTGNDGNLYFEYAMRKYYNRLLDGTYFVMLIEGSTAPTSFIPYGYKIPVTVTNGTDTITTPVYIGDTQLMADEYVSFSEQKIYRKVNGVLTPTNPPVPLPAISTFTSTNTLTFDTTVQPSNVYIRGKIKNV